MSEEQDIRDKISSGMVVRIHQKVGDEGNGSDVERSQIFEGLVIARKHGTEKGATITVRKTAEGGVGVEKIFPVYSPLIKKIEVIREMDVKQAKAYYLRDSDKKLKETDSKTVEQTAEV